MAQRTLRRVLLGCACAIVFAVLAFAARILLAPQAKELRNVTPTAVNRLALDDVYVPTDADGVYLFRYYYPPQVFIRFHAGRDQIRAWVSKQLRRKDFREVPIGGEMVDPGLGWFNPHQIQQGKAFAEIGVERGEWIFVDCDRCVVLFASHLPVE